MERSPLSFGRPIRGLATSSVRVLETMHAKGMRIARHHHDRASVSVVLDGCYQEDRGSGAARHPPLTTCFKPAGEPHANDFELCGARSLVIEISDVSDAVPDLDLRHPTYRRDPRPAALALRIWRELADPDALSPLSVEEWSLDLCSAALGEGPAPDLGSDRLRRTRSLLLDAPTHRWSLSRLACAVGLHPSHLARAFRARHGCTIGEYLRRLRVNEGARRLAAGDETIAAVSADLGFADQSHFTRAFRAGFRTTPAAWRRAFRRTQVAF